MNHSTCMILASFSVIMAGLAASHGTVVVAAWGIATVCCLLDASADRKDRA